MVVLAAQGKIKPLFLFVGKSASGKTTIASMLESDGYTQVSSYTTRPPRHKNEIGHVFITEEEYDNLSNIVASTLYNGYRYCTTLDQIQNADIYVVDPNGVSVLLDNYQLICRDVYVFYFDASVYVRINRMLHRGDNESHIIERLLHDEENNWFKDLVAINESHNRHAVIKIIDANPNSKTVYSTVKNLINLSKDKLN